MKIGLLLTGLAGVAAAGVKVSSSWMKSGFAVVATALMVELFAVAWLNGRPIVAPHASVIVAQPTYAHWRPAVPSATWPATWFSPPGHVPSHEPSRRSVMFIGDSFTSGVGVKPTESFPELVAGRLTTRSDTDVWIHARPGLNFFEQATLFESYSASWQPDVVVWVWVLNDVTARDRERACGVLDLGINDFIRDVTAQGFSASGSTAYDLLVTGRHRLQADACVRQTYLDRYDPDQPKSDLPMIQASLRDLVSWQTSRGGRFIVAIFPLMYDLQDYPFVPAHEAIMALATEAGAEVLDLYPAFEGMDETALWAHPTDHHPNAAGHQIAADAITAHLGDRLPAARPEVCAEFGPDEVANAFDARCRDPSDPGTWLGVSEAQLNARPEARYLWDGWRMSVLVNALQAGVLTDPEPSGVPEAPAVQAILARWTTIDDS